MSRMSQLGSRFDHLDRMLTRIGIWQHGDGSEPNKIHGYSIDDEARGLIVALRHWQTDTEPGFNTRMGKTCFQFICDASLSQGSTRGRYHNFCDEHGRWLDTLGSQDSYGRTLWGLGVAYAADAPFAPKRDVERLLAGSLTALGDLTHLRSKAFVILGLGEARVADILLRRLADEIADAYEKNADNEWRWFEPQMTYCNARLPQAMFVASSVFPEEERYERIGQESLDFLLQVSRLEKGGYAPIGNAPMATGGWYNRGDAHPPLFDQQPVDAGALVEACSTAYLATREPRFRKAAADTFGWYLGDNVHGISVYDLESGGVFDALTRTGVNANQGAESILSLHLAQQALDMIF